MRLNCCNACPLKTWQKRGSAPPGRQVHGSADRTRGGGRKSTDLVETANPHEALPRAARGGSYLDLVLDAKVLRSSGTPGRRKENSLQDASYLPPTLEALGITDWQSSRWQAEARQRQKEAGKQGGRGKKKNLGKTIYQGFPREKTLGKELPKGFKARKALLPTFQDRSRQSR